MLQYDFEESIGYWITLTSHFYQQQLNERLAPFGITFRQFQVLAWLVYEGRLTQSQLAQRLMIEPPTLAGILDRMQREDWIQRVPCDEDRRRRWVALHEGARPVWRRVVACLKQMRKRATLDMTSEEVETLKSLLMRVQQNLRTAHPFPEPTA